MQNKELKVIYDQVYKKGERQHYSKLLFAKNKISIDKKAVIGLINWKNKTVLDVGCGTGELADIAARLGAKKVLGVDYSTNAIAIAKKSHKHKNVFFECRNASDIRGRYDVITSLGTLEHFDNPFNMLKSFKDMLNPGGSIVVVSPNWSNPRGYMLMTLKLLFDAKITLADLHHLTPLDFERWARRLNLKLEWETVDFDWAMGPRLISDFRRRIPRVLRDSSLPQSKRRIADFIKWIENRVIKIERPQKYSGAIGVYHFRKR